MENWTPELHDEVDHLEHLLAGIRSQPVGGRSKKARERRRRNHLAEQELRSKIEAKCPSPPFKADDNGVHQYQECERYLIFRNHGESRWYGLLKPRGQEGHRLVHFKEEKNDAGELVGWTCGHRDPEVIRAAVLRELSP